MKTMMTLFLVMILAVPALAADVVLPLFAPGTIHIWNPGGSGAPLTMGDTTLWVPGMTEIVVPSNVSNTVRAVNTGDSLRVWIDIAGVVFEAQTAKTRWAIPVRKGTGIVMSNPGSNTVMTFTLWGVEYVHINGQLVGNTSFAVFVENLLQTGAEGTLIIESDQPIFVGAADCTDTCRVKPVEAR